MENHRVKVFFLAAISSCLISWINSEGTAHDSYVPVSAEVPFPPAPTQMFGINFSPYMDGQDPRTSVSISESQIRARMELVAPYTQWVRTFSMVDGLEKSGAIAHDLGLKAALGAWLGPESSAAGLAANQLNIANLIAAGQRGEADLLIVGSEVLLRRDLTSTRLAEYLNQVKTSVPGVPVAVAEVDNALLDAPLVTAAADVLLVNIYPFWEGVPLESAVYPLLARFRRMETLAEGKPVYLSETGWPSCGDDRGGAVVSLSNAASYFFSVQTMVQSENIPAFYFEAYDETWKANTEEGSRGACWGVWDKEGILKPGFESFFSGSKAPNIWSGLPPVDGPGAPKVVITQVPPYEDSASSVYGRVLHVSPDAYTVSLFIYVINNWWAKPTYARRVNIIQPDGSWDLLPSSGGMDRFALKFRVLVFPSGYLPTASGNSQTFPPSWESAAVAMAEVYRTPNPLGGTIRSPANEAVLRHPTVVQVDPESNRGITGVEFSVDGVFVATDTYHPFEFQWDPATVESGVHTLGARVLEITGTTFDVSVQVTKP